MLSEFKKIATEKGLTFDAKKNILHGKYNGYSVIVVADTQQRQYSILFSIKESNLKPGQTKEQFLSTLSQEKKYIRSNDTSNNNLNIIIHMKTMTKTNLKNLVELLDEVTTYLRRYNYISCCKTCATDNNNSVYSVNGQYIFSCDTCHNKMINELTTVEQEYKKVKGNLVAGIVGAFLGSLIGVILWFIIYQLGYIAAIAGLVTVVCAIKGYEKFGGKIDTIGIVLCFIISIVMIYFAHSICYAWDLYVAFTEIGVAGITVFDTFKILPTTLEEYDLLTSFYGDLAIGYLLMVVGSFSTIKSIYNEKSKKVSTEKVT